MFRKVEGESTELSMRPKNTVLQAMEMHESIRQASQSQVEKGRWNLKTLLKVIVQEMKQTCSTVIERFGDIQVTSFDSLH